MASNEAQKSQRKKRAWRKPREPITPEREGEQISHARPIKLQRNTSSPASVLLPSPSSQPAVPHPHPCREVEGGSEPGKKRPLLECGEDATAEEMEHKPATSVECAASKEPLAHQDHPVNIDGSTMEGVS